MNGWLASNTDYLVFLALVAGLWLGLGIWLHRSGRLATVPKIAWLLLVLVAGGGWWLVNRAGARAQQNMRREIELLVPYYAQEMQQAGHARLPDDPAPDDPLYLELIQMQINWLKLNPAVADIYTFRRRADGAIFLFVDSETDYNRDRVYEGEIEQRTEPGYVYENVTPGIERAFRGERVFDDEVTDDLWGTWVSSFAPLFGPDGKLEAVLGVDFDAAQWLQLRANARLTVLAGLGAVVLLLTGSSVLIAVLQHDLRRRRAIERQLREQIELRRSIFDGAPGGVILTGFDHRFLEVNESFCRMVGYTREELHRLTFLEITHPDDLELTRATARRVLAGEETQDAPMEKRYLRKDGSAWHVSVQVGLIRGPAGNPRYYVAQITDLTARRQAEAEREKMESKLLEVQKLESLGVLAGGVAHDFNNLLTAILGHAGLARLAIDQESPSAANIAQIEQAAQVAAGLCRQLLAYAGRGELDPQSLDLTGLARETAELFRFSTGSHARLAFNLAADLPPVLIDPTQVRQVLLNLVQNAAEAIGRRQDGAITITTRLLDVDAAWLAQARAGQELQPGAYPAVVVADNGPGISPEARRRVFDPFFSTKGAGRGLGLAAALGIVRSHRGALRLDSEPGQGTTFTLIFPPHQSPSPAAESSLRPAAPARDWRGQGTVLIVDDEEAVRATAGQMVAFFGFTVKEASSGRQAVEMLRERGRCFDLVLLDLTMPVMDGFATFAALREVQPGQRIIVFSGYSEQDTKEGFAGKDLNGFLPKPFSADALREVLREVTT